MAVKRVLPGLVCALFAANVLAADAGSKWWFNADQRGERLLQGGDAAEAARTFTDPRRKAFAALKAGDAAAAANQLSTLDDGDSHYNRGNALVQSGDLKGALSAYDQALERDPSNQDAKHNRERVEQALQQQNKPPEGQDPQGKSKPGDPSQPSTDKPSDQKGNGGQNGKDDPKPGADGASDDPRKDASNPAGKDAHGKSGEGAKPNEAQSPGAASPPPESADEAAKARRDVSGNLDRKPGDPAPEASAPADGGGEKNAGPNDAAAPVAPTTKTEQQLAEEQWLRRIPDDPGGLLRRKFMIEHLLRQQRKDAP